MRFLHILPRRDRLLPKHHVRVGWPVLHWLLVGLTVMLVGGAAAGFAWLWQTERERFEAFFSAQAPNRHIRIVFDQDGVECTVPSARRDAEDVVRMACVTLAQTLKLRGIKP